MIKGKHNELLGKSPHIKKTVKGQLIPKQTSYEHDIYELATNDKNNSK
jgi:hypothetical protein